MGSVLARRRQRPGRIVSTRRRTSRSSTTGGGAPRCCVSTHSPRLLSVRTWRRERCGALLHLELRLLVVGDGEHARCARSPRSTIDVAQPLGEHAGLARTGRGDHPGRPPHVGDRGELVGGQPAPTGHAAAGDGGPRPARSISAGMTAWPVTDVLPRLPRAAVDPRPPCRRPGARRRRRRRPSAVAPSRSRAALVDHHHTHEPVAAVVVVRPHEEVEAVEVRLGASASAATARRGSTAVSGTGRDRRRARRPPVDGRPTPGADVRPRRRDRRGRPRR